MLELNAPYWFYGKNYTNIFVSFCSKTVHTVYIHYFIQICKDGVLLFDDIFCDSNDSDVPRIVGYWGNITLTDSMTVYYDERDETENIDDKFENSVSLVQDYLHWLYQPGDSEFVPTHIFLTTWPRIEVDGVSQLSQCKNSLLLDLVPTSESRAYFIIIQGVLCFQYSSSTVL